MKVLYQILRIPIIPPTHQQQYLEGLDADFVVEGFEVIPYLKHHNLCVLD